LATEWIARLQNDLLKGSNVWVEGREVYRTYEDKLGHTRYVTQIQANYLVDLDR
jgi:single-stranded DNA-binding protein